MVSVSSSLARCCIFADYAERNVGEYLSELQLSEAPEGSPLSRCFGSRVLVAASEKAYPELTHTLLFPERNCLKKMVVISKSCLA